MLVLVLLSCLTINIDSRDTNKDRHKAPSLHPLYPLSLRNRNSKEEKGRYMDNYTDGMTLEEQIGQVKQFLTQMGAAEATITHPTTTLEDLFIRVVKENEGGDGAAKANAEKAKGNGAG